jgi:uncharacterized protein YndB with AHSA1/START domain
VPATRRSRDLAADPEAVWLVLADPHHLPRWWPRATRAEGVSGDRWTLVMTSSRGRAVRADYRLVESREPECLRWEQELEDTPFERLLAESRTTVLIEGLAGGGTRVTLELRQKMRGLARFGGVIVRRATGRLLEEALDGLEQALG